MCDDDNCGHKFKEQETAMRYIQVLYSSKVKLK